MLDELSQAVAPDTHAVVLMDRAGWHVAKDLAIPANLTPLFLPAYSPELNAIERVWLYLRERFLSHRHDRASFKDPEVLADFLKLDDHDIMGAVKVWIDHKDVVLSTLARDLVHRHNLRIRLQDEPWENDRVIDLKKKVAEQLGVSIEDAGHFVLTGSIVNNAYDPTTDRIELLYKDGSLRDIAEASADWIWVYRADRLRMGVKNMSMYATKADSVAKSTLAEMRRAPAYHRIAAMQMLLTISMEASSVASSTIARMLARRYASL